MKALKKKGKEKKKDNSKKKHVCPLGGTCCAFHV